MLAAYLIAALNQAPVIGGEQLLIPAGTFHAPYGAMMGSGPWRLDEAQGAALAQRLSTRQTDFPIDYEHQTLLAAKNGQPAPAAGWYSPGDILWRAGVGLVAAQIRWTDRASAMITAGEYRYLSPVFEYAENGEVLNLLHVALTNTPALELLPEVRLAAASFIYQEPTMGNNELRERLLYLLNLPVTTTDAELLAELDKLKTMISGDQTAAASIGLGQVLKARDERIAALTEAASTMAPLSVVQDLQAQIAALKGAELTRERSALVESGLADGRLLPGLKDWAMGLDLAALKGYLETAQPIAALSGTQTGGKAPAGTGSIGLTTEELAVCHQMNIDQTLFKSTKERLNDRTHG